MKPEKDNISCDNTSRCLYDIEHRSKCKLEKSCIHKISNDQLREKKLYELAELFKIFGDSTRINILYTLTDGEKCVCEIADTLNMTQSAISHQLRILKQSKLVKSRRDGKSIIYSLADDHVSLIIASGLEHVNE